MRGRRAAEQQRLPAPVVVLDGSSLPRGELLAGPGPDAAAPGRRDRGARRLAVVALLVAVVGMTQASDLRREQAAEQVLTDVLAVGAVVSVAGLSGSALEVGVTVTNSGPRPVSLRDARVVPGLDGAGPVVSGGRLEAGASTRVDLRLVPDCGQLEPLGDPRLLGVTAVAGSGRSRAVEVDVGEDLERLGRVACRMLPVQQALVLSASREQLVGDELRFRLAFARDTLRSGTLLGLESQGLRVRTTGLPRLLPLAGRDAPEEVDVVVEVADCGRLVLNPRGYLLTLGLRVADGAGRRDTVFTGIGRESAPLNRLAAGLLVKACGFDPLFRTA
jgi:hypothetical protein